MKSKAFEKRHRSPFLSGAIDRTNAVTAWVMTDILRTKDLRTRALAVSRWIDLAKQLREINNFAGVIEIMMALQNSCISRLKVSTFFPLLLSSLFFSLSFLSVSSLFLSSLSFSLSFSLLLSCFHHEIIFRSRSVRV